MADPDPKPKKRYTADAVEWRLMTFHIRERHPVCQVCDKDPWEDLHHIVPRAQSGDDVEANLMPLCRACHQDVTDNKLPALMLLRWALTPAQRHYVVSRKGTGWLEMKYPAVMA